VGPFVSSSLCCVLCCVVLCCAVVLLVVDGRDVDSKYVQVVGEILGLLLYGTPPSVDGYLVPGTGVRVTVSRD
jgi:hypothetical protein